MAKDTPKRILPPATVAVGPFSYDLGIDPVKVSNKAVELGFDLLGYTDNTAQDISVAPGMGPLLERETVLHEVLHAVFAVTGSRELIIHDGQEEHPKKDDPYGLEERVIRALCTTLFGVLRDNPDLVAYLTSE